MADLVKIQTNDNLEQVVSARELHEKLGIRERFSLWFERIQKTLSLNEGIDYCRHTYTNANNQTFPDYLIPIDIAKHICMVSGGERAHIIRQYFIEVEKAWNSPEMVMSRALKLAERKIMSLEEERQALLPKAQGYDYLMNAQGTVTIGEAAKIIDIKGIGQNKFFKILVAEGIIYKKGNSYLPYSEYKEHFVVKQNPIPMGDMVVERSQLYLDMAGLDWLAKLLARRGYEVNYTQKKALVG